MDRELLLAVLGVGLVVAALVGGIPVFRPRRDGRPSPWAARGEGFAMGVFLGAGLVHMLPEAQSGFAAAGSSFPWAFALCGGVLLAFAGLERLHAGEAGTAGNRLALPVASTLVLAVHSFLAGAALGATGSRAAILALSAALFAHKTVAAFALATVLGRSSLSPATARVAFACFVAALPLGMVTGDAMIHWRQAWPLAVPTIMALGAGTFLCLATRHGHHDFRRPNAAGWSAAIVGYACMVAIAVFS